MSPRARAKPLVCGGVPEHFNLPWRIASETGFWESQGVDIDWVEQEGGTGQMLERLETGELDVAVLLTEGILTARAKGLKADIVGLYIESPLLWGAHVSASSSYKTLRGLKRGARFAITRSGSGSHLMAFVLAEQLGRTLTAEDFVIVKTLDGARAALSSGEADVLLWDRYMLARLVKAGELRRLGVVPTPWPSFVLAAPDKVLKSRWREIDRASRAIAELAATLRTDPLTIPYAQRSYGLLDKDVRDWLKTTQWRPGRFSDAERKAVLKSLRAIGVLDERGARVSRLRGV